LELVVTYLILYYVTNRKYKIYKHEDGHSGSSFALPKNVLYSIKLSFSVISKSCFMDFDDISEENIGEFKERLITTMHEIGKKYPDCGYGGRFYFWIVDEKREPYNSFGNGSAMRVSPVGWYAKTLEEAEMIAKATAEVSHNHPEGIKGAVVTAGAVFLARTGATIEEIKKYVSKYYTIGFTLDDIRPSYGFDVTCQGSVPQAMQCFFESDNFEAAVRNAISIGGDSDTIAAITGAVAEAYYGIDEDIKETALSFLDERLLDIALQFEEKIVK